MTLPTYVYLLSAALVLFVVFVLFRTWNKPTPKPEYKYTGPVPLPTTLAMNHSLVEPERDENGHKYIKYIPGTCINRKNRRALLKQERSSSPR
jgi:hypothetical protein